MESLPRMLCSFKCLMSAAVVSWRSWFNLDSKLRRLFLPVLLSYCFFYFSVIELRFNCACASLLLITSEFIILVSKFPAPLNDSSSLILEISLKSCLLCPEADIYGESVCLGTNSLLTLFYAVVILFCEINYQFYFNNQIRSLFNTLKSKFAQNMNYFRK